MHTSLTHPDTEKMLIVIIYIITDIEKYPSAHTCFQYVINMVTVSNQINECFKGKYHTYNHASSYL